nr:hypothetical protein [Cronobacter sakazakii]
MPGLNRNITVLRLNIPGGIDHFRIRITRRVFLHPQAVARENIAALVSDTVGIKGKITGRIEQRGIDDAARRGERQAAAGAGKTVHGDVAATRNSHIAAAL